MKNRKEKLREKVDITNKPNNYMTKKSLIFKLWEEIWVQARQWEFFFFLCIKEYPKKFERG